jgi:hypothetical protein
VLGLGCGRVVSNNPRIADVPEGVEVIGGKLFFFFCVFIGGVRCSVMRLMLMIIGSD